MPFTLESLDAGNGDCFLLHYGPTARPQAIVIDGGPDAAYRQVLRPRLEQLRRPGNPLDIELVLVTHIDDDHIRGILDWFSELDDPRASLRHRVGALWFNGFSDPPARGCLASFAQGHRLGALARRLAIPLNAGFAGAIVSSAARVSIGDGLTFTVLGPSSARLDALDAAWRNTAAFTDRSVANLSSIVVLAESQGRRMLLAGDARGDDILAGLRAAGCLSTGRLHVDLFKLPHHGSSRNAAPEMFRWVTADHYVISANGRHGNPDPEVFAWLAAARGAEPYAIHLTHPVPAAFLSDHPSPGRVVRVRPPEALSLSVELLAG